MARSNMGTVVGVFHDHEDARKAIRALKDSGFREDQIGVATSNTHGLHGVEGDDAGAGTYAGEGAVTGLAAGAGVGALWGLGIVAGVLPAIGPAIAGGTLAAILSSAAAGAAAAGLAGALVGMGISKEEAEYYESEMKAGRTIVTVTAGDRRSEALAILQRFGGYDMSTRLSATHAETTTAHTGLAAHAAPTGGDTMRAHEERLHVEKKPVEAGEVAIHKEIHTEHRSIDVPVTKEEVVVERRPVSGKEVPASSLKEGQEIRIPVKEEQVNVEKHAVVTEEVKVGKRKVKETEHIDEPVRKEEIKVEKHGDVHIRDEHKK